MTFMILKNKRNISAEISGIASGIERFWQKGIILSKSSIEFIESSVGIVSEPELRDALTSDEFPDKEMALEMILFPDEDIRVFLETLIPFCGLGNAEVQTIIHYLIVRFPSLNLYHTKTSEPFSVMLSKDQIQLYISRLFLKRKLDPEVFHYLDTILSPEDLIRIRILFRTQKYQFKGIKKQFVMRFIRKSETKRDRLLAVFDLFLSIISQAPEAVDLELYLLETLRKQKVRLKQIQEFEEKQNRYSMEYLMMSKYPVPPESLENVREKLCKLEVIIYDILGIHQSPDMDLSLVLNPANKYLD